MKGFCHTRAASLIFLALMALAPASSQAAGFNVAEILNSSAGWRIVTENVELRLIAEEALGRGFSASHNAEEMSEVVSKLPSLAAERRARLENSLKEIYGDYEKYRAMDRIEPRDLSKPQGSLGDRDEFVIDELTRRQFAEGGSESAGIQSRSYEANTARLVSDESVASPEDPSELPARELTEPEEISTQVKKDMSFFEELKACNENQTPSQREHSHKIFTVINLGMSAVSTIVGYVTASGSKKTDWRGLPKDLFINLATTFIGSRAAFEGQEFGVRWKNLSFAGAKNATLDAGVYYVWNVTADKADPVQAAEDTSYRYVYNLEWNHASGLYRIPLNDLILGLECKYPNWIGKAAGIGTRFVASVPTGFVYFWTRKHVAGH